MDGQKLQARFSIQKVFHNFPSSQFILQNINAEIRPSRMTTIIGPSGAGNL
jgi:ABC-type phosphate/phosphonate transport system ATPase subunit